MAAPAIRRQLQRRCEHRLPWSRRVRRRSGRRPELRRKTRLRPWRWPTRAAAGDSSRGRLRRKHLPLPALWRIRRCGWRQQTVGTWGAGGGAGGGALLIASTVGIIVNGTIRADGGPGINHANCALASGGGGGGAIRLAAPVISGSGVLSVAGGVVGACGGTGSAGRVRLEAFENRYAGPSQFTKAAPMSTHVTAATAERAGAQHRRACGWFDADRQLHAARRSDRRGWARSRRHRSPATCRSARSSSSTSTPKPVSIRWCSRRRWRQCQPVERDRDGDVPAWIHARVSAGRVVVTVIVSGVAIEKSIRPRQTIRRSVDKGATGSVQGRTPPRLAELTLVADG